MLSGSAYVLKSSQAAGAGAFTPISFLKPACVLSHLCGLDGLSARSSGDRCRALDKGKECSTVRFLKNLQPKRPPLLHSHHPTPAWPATSRQTDCPLAQGGDRSAWRPEQKLQKEQRPLSGCGPRPREPGPRPCPVEAGKVAPALGPRPAASERSFQHRGADSSRAAGGEAARRSGRPKRSAAAGCTRAAAPGDSAHRSAGSRTSRSPSTRSDIGGPGRR